MIPWICSKKHKEYISEAAGPLSIAFKPTLRWHRGQVIRRSRRWASALISKVMYEDNRNFKFWWDSVPRKKVVRYSLEGTVVGQTHKWALNGCSSSRELGAQYVQPHQRPKNTIPAGKKDMPVAPSTQCHVAMRESAEKIVSGCSEQRRLIRMEDSRATHQLQERQDKMANNSTANCFTILKRITRWKCVNSEVSLSAFSLKRVPSHVSMAPCRRHHGNHTRQELDHCSDPSGTESQKRAIDEVR